jgi:hypothetical protein
MLLLVFFVLFCFVLFLFCFLFFVFCGFLFLWLSDLLIISIPFFHPDHVSLQHIPIKMLWRLDGKPYLMELLKLVSNSFLISYILKSILQFSLKQLIVKILPVIERLACLVRLMTVVMRHWMDL